MNTEGAKFNELFYRWIRTIKRAIINKRQFIEKMNFFENKLTSCKGTKFDKIPIPGSNSFKNMTLFYLSKIEELEGKLNELDSMDKNWM